MCECPQSPLVQSHCRRIISTHLSIVSQNKVYLAVGLGAGSGCVLAGEFDGKRIELHELNRFENTATAQS